MPQKPHTLRKPQNAISRSPRKSAPDQREEKATLTMVKVIPVVGGKGLAYVRRKTSVVTALKK